MAARTPGRKMHAKEGSDLTRIPMHDSIPAVSITPGQSRDITWRCQFRGWGTCNFILARELTICEPGGCTNVILHDENNTSFLFLITDPQNRGRRGGCLFEGALIRGGEGGANSGTYGTQNKAAKDIWINEKFIIRLTFNLGLALTGFQTVFNKLSKIELQLQKSDLDEL